MRGPNAWSSFRHKLIVAKLDIEDPEETPTNLLHGFGHRLEKMFPSMYKHRCSEEREGGFFDRVKEGTSVSHVVEHIALEIQCMAGMECSFGRSKHAGKNGIYHVVFAYAWEDAGIYAAKAAVKIAEALIKGEEYPLDDIIAKLEEINKDNSFGPSTLSLIEEAEKRGIPYTRLDSMSRVMLGYGSKQKIIQATMTSTTSSMGVETAADKSDTKKILEEACIPVPVGKIIYSEETLQDAIQKIGFPLVIKPYNGNHGRGVTTNITTPESAMEGFRLASEISGDVIVEKFIAGDDYRLLVINYKLVAAARRTPASVTGDGVSSIEKLIEETNRDPRRGSGHEKELSRIIINELTLNLLADKGYNLETVPAENEIVYLKDTANISTGGKATDVTDLLHPMNIKLAERTARLIGLDICGIDVIAPNLSTPLTQNGGAVIEVNAAPGFRMHIAPSAGTARNVAEPVLDMLFPHGSTFTIPIVAITGTNGKTTTSRLVAFMASKAGFHTGLTTTEGVYIDGMPVKTGDCTGPVSAQMVLRDPWVDFAVMECARGGMVRSGLGFSKCDIGIVTNVGDDHLGLGDVNTIEDMARVKSIVPRSVHHNGYAVLNAGDDLVYRMAEVVESNVALFSLNENNPRIVKHCERGGVAATVRNGYIMIYNGKWKIKVAKVEDVPLTFGGRAGFMLENVLAATLAGFLSKFRLEDIQAALHTFIPSPELTPGRMNLFKFNSFDVLVDFAHNTHGYLQLSKFLETVKERPMVGIIAAVGDRRDEDLVNIGRVAADMFDELIIRQDKDLRGRTEEEIVRLVTKGIHEKKPGMTVTAIRQEKDAIIYAIRNAVKGSFITVCSDKVMDAIEVVQKFKAEEEKFEQVKETVLGAPTAKLYQ